ncbi:zinc ribbon domain-containing protein [Microbacterium marinilacus]|uniref:C4-type zinc ribbon domain-containing protein n=1 Tax=Microbacterium marinilacus TaxID=415209 RepID=A0ABP7B1D0_9MICO|nr:C4-type zinc ribbon domain-containing protein [Microbacterium marinilacus]MBY0688666.1 DNA-binding protein [Microbacterium marinilacus]
MKASPADQLLLLDVADIDRRLASAESTRRNPPQAARVQELIAQRTALGRELAERAGARDDLRTELKRIESDVEVVAARRARDAERLATTASPKDAQGLEREIATLDKRRSDLEDAELEIMERLEAADSAVTEQQALLDATTAEGQRLSGEAKELVSRAASDAEALTRDRSAIADRLPADLLGLYERLAARGTGTAAFTRGMCGACNMTLSPSDLQVLRGTPDDEVALCPECGGIMVRTAESGL